MKTYIGVLGAALLTQVSAQALAQTYQSFLPNVRFNGTSRRATASRAVGPPTF